MDDTAPNEAPAVPARASELRARAAEARRAAVAERRRSEEAFDRAAAVLIGFGGRPFGDRGPRFVLRLGRARPLLRFVRHDLRRWLERSGLPADRVSDLTLACSEACANAVEHPRQAGRQLVEVEAVLDGTQLELRVRDFGVWNERRGSRSRGRGLEMIREVMDSFDVQRTPEGTELVMRSSRIGRRADAEREGEETERRRAEKSTADAEPARREIR